MNPNRHWLAGVLAGLLVASAGPARSQATFEILNKFKREFSQIDDNVGTFSDEYQRDKRENMGFAQATRARNERLAAISDRIGQLNAALAGPLSPAQRFGVQTELRQLLAEQKALMQAEQTNQEEHNRRITNWGRKVGASSRPNSYFAPSRYAAGSLPQRKSGVYSRFQPTKVPAGAQGWKPGIRFTPDTR
jgi:hypothetical protein